MKRYVIPLLFLSIVINILLTLFVFVSNPLSTPSEHKIYPFLSKRIFAENQNDVLINFSQLRTQLRSYVSRLPNMTGFYFEYLPSGTSIGVNEKDQFIPASLIKVPIVMAIYKKIESGKLNKNDFITLEARYKDKTSGDLWQKPDGSRIAVQEAITMTLDDSDNTAKNLLLSRLTREEISFVFDSLDLDLDSQNNETSTITPKNYSSVLRSLYLSSYLNREYSNEILELLSQSVDDRRLRSGLPDEIKVSSKFGVSLGRTPQTSIYSDCGIVYLPKRPFLLCVMTQTDEKNAEKIMKDLAELSYSFVAGAKP